MLVELSVVEQRYHAVMEVVCGGVPVVEVARRQHHCIGQHFAGRRITLRLETTLAHVVLDGVLTRTIPLTLTLPNAPSSRRPHPRPRSTFRPTSHPGAAHRVLPRRHPNHRPTRPSRTTLRRANRHHRSRRDHPARLRPTRTLDQACSPHQPQGGHPTQGLRSHHQPKNRLGTVTHQLKTIRHPSCGVRQSSRAVSSPA
jgi:hypothetical protein